MNFQENRHSLVTLMQLRQPKNMPTAFYSVLATIIYICSIVHTSWTTATDLNSPLPGQHPLNLNPEKRRTSNMIMKVKFQVKYDGTTQCYTSPS